ncbi:multidrug transporter [Photobacterium japonica]|uniref:MATE family Na+-driven efflux transporter n=1 Tax=Photobacterium japonica TaxID=2910235 RepID=UPI003D102376
MGTLRNINYKLWMVLILTSFIPLIYSTSRIHFLGDMPNTWSFSIAAQVAWLNIFYEVLSEALLIPLAFILGGSISDNVKYRIRMSTSFSIVMITYLIVTTYVLMYTPDLVKTMGQEAQLEQQTIEYIRLESIAILISSAYAFFNLTLILKNSQKALYALLIMQTILTVLGDYLFVSQHQYSLRLGVTGIAITNILANLILSVIAVRFLTKEGLKLSNCQFSNQPWIFTWFKIGSKSGIESFVRNCAFLVMILQLINQVQQAGTYWVTNNFIWGWLLLPILALGQLIKRDTAINHGLSSDKINGYFTLTFICILFWFISLPYWELFITHIMGIDKADEIISLTMLLVGFYVVFAFNNVIDSYFYGLGRTDLILYQSLAVNILFYGSAFIAYHAGWYTPSLETIAWMFGLGLIFDAAITFGLYLWLRRIQQTFVLHKLRLES